MNTQLLLLLNAQCSLSTNQEQGGGGKQDSDRGRVRQLQWGDGFGSPSLTDWQFGAGEIVENPVTLVQNRPGCFDLHLVDGESGDASRWQHSVVGEASGEVTVPDDRVVPVRDVQTQLVWVRRHCACAERPAAVT